MIRGTSLSCTKAFRKVVENSPTKSQYNFYLKNGAHPVVLELARLENNKFGSVSEDIIKEVLSLSGRTSVQHDATLNGLKIEIKSARYWSKLDCYWQHLYHQRDYDIMIFALLDFQGYLLWKLSKERIVQLTKEGVVYPQGQQGYWTRLSRIRDYLEPISEQNDLKPNKLV